MISLPVGRDVFIGFAESNTAESNGKHANWCQPQVFMADIGVVVFKALQIYRMSIEINTPCPATDWNCVTPLEFFVALPTQGGSRLYTGTFQ